MRNEFYRDAHGLLLVMDVTRRETFEILSDWVAEIKLEVGGYWIVMGDTEGSLCFKPALNCTTSSPVVTFWIILEGFLILMRLCRM